VVLDVPSGGYFELNEVATLVWHGLERPRTTDELVGEIVAEFEVDSQRAGADLLELLERLLELGLVEEVGSASGP